MNKILVISPHPDDESLGCGGSLLRLKAEGGTIHWLNISDISEQYGYEKEAVIKRQQEIEHVRNLYGFDGFFNLALKPMFLDGYPLNELINKISDIVNTVKPDTVFLPFLGDTHSDHRTVFKAAYPCTKIFRYPFIKKTLMMEIISETDFAPPITGSQFAPNFFIDISDFMDRKVQIMEEYKSELGVHPFPRSRENISALAVRRGAQAGCRYAEGFMLLKAVDDIS